MSQSFVKEAWTIVCVNDPQFNDIAREIFFNAAWESWLSDHLVKAMINYPDAVLLGKPFIINNVVTRQCALRPFFDGDEGHCCILNCLDISDIGSNIGPHSLTVAAMDREVVVLDGNMVGLLHKISDNQF